MSLIIAEIGTSHQGDINKAIELVDLAVSAGANAVKFQWVYADEILHPNTGFVQLPTGNVSLYDRFKQFECDFDFYKTIKDYVKSKNVKFVCSPFGIKSLQELLQLNPDYVKIASPELNHFPMLKALAEYRQNQEKQGIEPIPVILSSGVSLLKDIEKAISILGKKNISLLHCITSYPAPEDEYNLKLVENLRNIFGIPTGVSDHSKDPVLVPTLAVAFGAEIIEKHITISNETDGLDDPIALNGEQFALMCHCINQTNVALKHYGKSVGFEKIVNQLKESYDAEKISSVIGSGQKYLAPSELNNYGRTNRSLHYMKDFSKGTKITENDIGVLRTEKILTPGISPEFFDDICGANLKCDVCSGEGVLLKHFI